MKRIAKNLTVYYTYILANLALFAVFCYGLFNMMNAFYASKHTGEETSGYTYLVADSLSVSMYSLVEEYMSDSEQMKWQESYQAGTDGTYSLKADVRFSETLKNLEETFLVPQAVAYQVLNMDSSELGRILSENGITEQDYLAVRDCLEEEMLSEGEDAIRKYAWAFIRTQLEEDGISLTDAKAAFYYRLILKLILAFCLMLGGILGGGSVINRVKQTIFFRMDDREIRSAQLGLIFIIYLIAGGIILSAFGLIEIGRKYTLTACLWFLLPLLFMTVVIWALLTLPFLEGICGWFYRFSKLGKHYRRVRRIVFYYLPVLLVLVSFAGFSSVQRAICGYMLIAAGMIAAGAFYLPAVFAQAEIVQYDN